MFMISIILFNNSNNVYKLRRLTFHVYSFQMYDTRTSYLWQSSSPSDAISKASLAAAMNKEI